MRKSLAFLLVLGSLVMAQRADAKPDTAQLFVEAMLTANVEVLDKILAGNYLHINGNGYMQDKENLLASLRDKKMVVDHLTISDVTTSHYGNATLMTGTLVFKGKFKPKLPEGLHRVTLVIEKQGAAEKIILYHATPVRARAMTPAEAKINGKDDQKKQDKKQ